MNIKRAKKMNSNKTVSTHTVVKLLKVDRENTENNQQNSALLLHRAAVIRTILSTP